MRPRSELERAVSHAKASTTDETLSNTQWFLLDANEDLEVEGGRIVDQMDLDDVFDPSRPPDKDLSVPYMRWWLRRRVIRTLPFRLLTLMMIVVDLVIVLVDLFDACAASNTSRTLALLDLGLSIFFVLEIALRVFSLSVSVFFEKRHWFNVVDLVVVVVTFTLSLLTFILVHTLMAQGAFDAQGCPRSLASSGAHVELMSAAKVLVVFRAVRFVRLVRLVRIYTEHHQIKRAVRQTVSQNKRRYQRGDVDLDLTYVTTRIVATSFPSSGWMAWYRNNIVEVSHFLERHHAHHYRVYNLCSERTYEEKHFDTGQLCHLPLDDHNVPTVRQMVDFVLDVTNFLGLEEDNVVVVHCKGGKGRTGTMICVLLIHFALFRDAASSLEYFGQRRTDESVSRTFQGVETASQIRYVTYYETLNRRNVVKWPRVRMRILSITIEGVESVGRGDGSDLRVSIWQPSGQTFSLSESFVPISSSTTMLKVGNDVVVEEDVRLKFLSKAPNVPNGYENCAFYFWFHTTFVYWSDAQGDRAVLRLRREEVDNPHKEKVWNIYKENFAVILELSVVSIDTNESATN